MADYNYDYYDDDTGVLLGNPGYGTPEFEEAARRSSQGYNQPTPASSPSTPSGPRYQGGGISGAKWNDPNHKTPKYDVLRILDQIAPSAARQQFASGAGSLVDQLKALGFSIQGDDKIYRSDLGSIDVIHGDNSEYGWNTGAGKVTAKPQPLTVANSHGPGTPGGSSLLPGGGSSTFSDPLTKQYEALLNSQTALYRQQQERMAQEAAQQEAVRQQTAAAAKRLTDFLNQRIDKLSGPAYTGTEQEVLRSQLLDPLERDRQAALSRSLNNIGSRGFDPSSGIAQDLLKQTNSVYDQARARTQGDIAYAQIQEQRSREQEAAELLKYLTQLPQATARGDLDFVNYLDSLVSQPGERALATSALLADLPVQRTQLALQTLGLGGQPQSAVPNVMALLNNAQANRLMQQSNNADYWRNIGLSFI